MANSSVKVAQLRERWDVRKGIYWLGSESILCGE